MILALASLASAQDAQDPPPPPPREEIIVYGRLAVDRARDEVIYEMERIGWRVRSEKDGRTILAPPASWIGAAVLEADGTITFRDPIFATGVPSETWALDPRYEDPTAGTMRSSEVAPNMPYTPYTPVIVGGTTTIPSKRKRDTIRARVLAETQDEVDELRTVLRATEAADRGAGP